jgi:hypothetical protein
MSQLDELADAVAPTRARPRTDIPGYGAIKTGSRMLRAFALLLALASFVPLQQALYFIDRARDDYAHRHPMDFDSRSAVICAASWLGCLAIAALLNLAGSLAMAVRDIARNSFLGHCP